jgi:hypothetical protein
MVEAGAIVEGGSANFSPGLGAPSLQVNQVSLMVGAVRVAARAGAGHSSEVAGQQSQSILSSIWSNVRLLCPTNARYTLDGVAPG